MITRNKTDSILVENNGVATPIVADSVEVKAVPSKSTIARRGRGRPPKPLETLIKEADESFAKGENWSDHVLKHGLYKKSVATWTTLAGRFGVLYAPRNRQESSVTELTSEQHLPEAASQVLLNSHILEKWESLFERYECLVSRIEVPLLEVRTALVEAARAIKSSTETGHGVLIREPPTYRRKALVDEAPKTEAKAQADYGGTKEARTITKVFTSGRRKSCYKSGNRPYSKQSLQE